jgi:hypothetical protein
MHLYNIKLIIKRPSFRAPISLSLEMRDSDIFKCNRIEIWSEGCGVDRRVKFLACGNFSASSRTRFPEESATSSTKITATMSLEI